MARLPEPVRRTLAPLLGSIRLPIRGGPNRGFLWSLASSGRGYVSGRFEALRLQALVALLEPGDRFWDVGAHKGYVALAASRAVGAAGSVLAFEPASINRDLLERHLTWNRAANTRVLPIALSDVDGIVSFGGSGSSITYHIGGEGETVRSRTLDSLVSNEEFPCPTVLKIDVEHAEAEVLRGARDHLPRIDLVWVSLHSRQLFERCRQLFEEAGHVVYPASSLAARISDPDIPWGEDQELLAVAPHRTITEDRIRELSLFS